MSCSLWLVTAEMKFSFPFSDLRKLFPISAIFFLLRLLLTGFTIHLDFERTVDLPVLSLFGCLSCFSLMERKTSLSFHVASPNPVPAYPLSRREKKTKSANHEVVTTTYTLPGGRKSEPLFYSPSVQFYAFKVRVLCRELRINLPTKSSRNKLSSGACVTLKSLITALYYSHLMFILPSPTPLLFLLFCLYPLIRSLNSVTSVHFNSTHIIR